MCECLRECLRTSKKLVMDVLLERVRVCVVCACVCVVSIVE